MAREKFVRSTPHVNVARWKSLRDSITVLFYEKKSRELSKLLKDIQDQIVILTIKNNCEYDELSKSLQHNFFTLDDFKVKEIDVSDDRKMIFEIGRLYGTMELSSRICYEKKQDSQVYEAGLSVCGIKHFDEIVSMLDKRKQLTQTDLCSILKMKSSALSECMKKILATEMVVGRRSGKYKVYSLSDDGLRYARVLRLEKQRENKKLSNLIREQFNNCISFYAGFLDNEKTTEEKSKMSNETSEHMNAIKNYYNPERNNDDYDNNDFENVATKKKGNCLCVNL